MRVSEFTKEFIKKIELSFNKGFRPSEVFEALLDGCLMDISSVFGAKIPEVKKRLRMPEKYDLELIEYRDCLMRIYVQALFEGELFEDYLGPVYMELSSRYKQKGMGQYFTPMSIGRLMAAFNQLPEKKKVVLWECLILLAVQERCCWPVLKML